MATPPDPIGSACDRLRAALAAGDPHAANTHLSTLLLRAQMAIRALGKAEPVELSDDAWDRIAIDARNAPRDATRHTIALVRNDPHFSRLVNAVKSRPSGALALANLFYGSQARAVSGSWALAFATYQVALAREEAAIRAPEATLPPAVAIHGEAT